jgi:large subunit ribosomal protein L29
MAGAGDYRQQTPEELLKRVDEVQKELFNLRLKVGQQRNSGRIRELRRDLARMKTVLHEKGIGT